MNKIKNLMLIILTITMSFLINGCAKKAPEGLVATVNEEKITIEEFNKEYEIRTNTMKSKLEQEEDEKVEEDEEDEEVEMDEKEVKDEVLSIYIIEKLIIQDALEEGIKVSDEELEKRIEDIRVSIGGEEGFKKYQEALGMDDEYFQSFIKKDMIIEKHKKSYMEKLELSDKEVKKVFKENKKDLTHIKARQILVDSQEEGTELLKQLKNGADFKALAIEKSIDPDTALEGGDLGYFSKGDNPKEFDDLVFALKEGEISPLIQTNLGYHIVEILEIKDRFEDLKEETLEFAREKKYVEYLKNLEDDGEIEIYLEEIHKEDEE